MNSIHNCRRFGSLLILPLASFALFGCSEQEQIRSYTVAKDKNEQSETVATKPAAPVGEPTDRMMGAIVPVGNQTWYFKVTGPLADIDQNAKQIEDFFGTIQVDGGGEKPQWTTPEGWNETGPTGMRAATLKIPAEPVPLELSVIALPTTGAPNELLDNVNRWRGQMQLPPVDADGLKDSVKQAKAGEVTMTIVDLRGKASAGGMMAPFAGGGPFSGGAAPNRDAASATGAGRPPASSGALANPNPAELPPNHPPIAGRDPINPVGGAPFQFDAPKSWQQQPAAGMRKAAFSIEDNGKKAEVTVIDLLASAPSIADPLQNVNRWRTELGLGPIQKEQLEGVVQKIEISGMPADYVELIPDASNPAESQASEATIAATLPAGRMIWFFKLRGDRELVVAERDNFKTFLKSIRFESDSGAADGNK